MRRSTTNSVTVVMAIIFLIVVIAFVPIIFIWSLNTLFGLATVVTLKTWFAALVFILIIGGAKTVGNSK